MFCVSQLKQAIGTNLSPLNIPKQLAPVLEVFVEPEVLKEVRTILKNGEEVVEALLQWRVLSEFGAKGRV